ncbi:MAG: GNAT family N-acetyltransferase [Patescibacteria group bacterium]|nr:GNAT family N-acetyltransferase [Patescibacteria group bacterium]
MNKLNNYKIRQLKLDDLNSESFFKTLSSLRPVENLSLDLAQKIFFDCQEKGVKTFVLETDGLIVGTVRVLYEAKFYHQGKLAAHIEDVSTHKDYMGKGVAGFLIREIIEDCKKNNCYKIILDCSDDLLGFYKKFGFEKKENCMRIDL